MTDQICQKSMCLPSCEWIIACDFTPKPCTVHIYEIKCLSQPKILLKSQTSKLPLGIQNDPVG